MDLLSEYWQVESADSCKETTTFSTSYGSYQFEVTPSCLTNGPSTSQRMILVATQSLTFVSANIDDVLTLSESMREHSDHLQELFSQTGDHGLKVEVSARQTGPASVQLLGRVVDAGRTTVEECKIAAISHSLTGTATTELRSFAGLAGYYLVLVKTFAEQLFCSTCLYIWKQTVDLYG